MRSGGDSLPTGSCLNSSPCHLHEEEFEKETCNYFGFLGLFSSSALEARKVQIFFFSLTAEKRCELVFTQNVCTLSFDRLLPPTFIISPPSLCDFLPPGPRSLPPGITSILHFFFSSNSHPAVDAPPNSRRHPADTPFTSFQMYVFLFLAPHLHFKVSELSQTLFLLCKKVKLHSSICTP